MLLPSSWLPASLLLQDKSYKFLTSHIYFHLDDCEQRKQYKSLSQQKMIGQICGLKTDEPQEVSIKICVMFYNALLN